MQETPFCLYVVILALSRVPRPSSDAMTGNPVNLAVRTKSWERCWTRAERQCPWTFITVWLSFQLTELTRNQKLRERKRFPTTLPSSFLHLSVLVPGVRKPSLTPADVIWKRTPWYQGLPPPTRRDVLALVSSPVGRACIPLTQWTFAMPVYLAAQ